MNDGRPDGRGCPPAQPSVDCGRQPRGEVGVNGMHMYRRKDNPAYIVAAAPLLHQAELHDHTTWVTSKVFDVSDYVVLFHSSAGTLKEGWHKADFEQTFEQLST
jgi:hypothetical protein